MSDADGRPAAAGAAERLAIVGAGRAGRAIAAAVLRCDAADAADVRLVALHGRAAHGASEGLPPVTTGAIGDAVRDATVVLVAVQDAALDDALRSLLDGGLAADAAVLHASGARDPAALALLRGRGLACGTFHPLVPLLGAATADRMRDAWVGIDGDPRALRAARRLARAIGATTLEIPAGAKPRYHAAAVVASNFPVVLAALAARLMRDAGVAPEAADGAVRALLDGAARNVAALPSLAAERTAAALSGPTSRGDVDTVALHLAAIDGDPVLRRAYAALTAAAVETLRAGGREVPRLGEVERLVDGRG